MAAKEEHQPPFYTYRVSQNPPSNHSKRTTPRTCVTSVRHSHAVRLFTRAFSLSLTSARATSHWPSLEWICTRWPPGRPTVPMPWTAYLPEVSRVVDVGFTGARPGRFHLTCGGSSCTWCPTRASSTWRNYATASPANSKPSKPEVGSFAF